MKLNDVLPKLNFTTDSALMELKADLDEYYPNLLPEEKWGKKDKRLLLIKKTYDNCKNREKAHELVGSPESSRNKPIKVYTVQLEGVKWINRIEESHLLAMNDVVVEPLIQEYSNLKEILMFLNEELKSMNQFPEMKGLVPKFDIKQLKSMLFDDLMTLKDGLNLDLDPKELVKGI